MSEILQHLNDAQRRAVEAIEGPSLIIAGAGSGKTRVLTYRVAFLLEKKVDPFNILALTFTNKSAREMKDRIIHLVGQQAKNVWMGTFHSIFARVLRIEGEKLGFPSNFNIYDTDDSKRLIRSIVSDLNLDSKTYSPGFVLGRISGAKSNLISAIDYNNNAELQQSDRQASRPELGKIFSTYQARLFRSQAMDFDDLLFNMNVLLRDFPEALYKYQQKFRYILVDEYQDTNYAQYLILKRLAANNENISVVGDDAQSIYAFRGANIQNMLNFKKDYPDYQLFKLEQNYRSTKLIVKAANSVIAFNKDQIQKTVWTDNDTGEKIKLLKAVSDNEEGAIVANTIFEQMMNFQRKNSDFAILYRTNAQSRAMEEALRKRNIAYRIYGGLSFYKRKEIKDICAYYRLVINNMDEDALKRCINYPTRGIGDTSLEKATIKAAEENISLWETLEKAVHYNLDIRQNILSRIHQFMIMIKSHSVKLKTTPAYDLAKQIAYSSGIIKELEEDKTPEGVSRMDNVEELLNAIADFTESDEVLELPDGSIAEMRSLDLFMQDIALLTDADNEDKEGGDKVSLMTIHAAKGLEFPYIFLVGLEENLFPSFMSLNSRTDLEEERRLFYVAVTRAEEFLFLSYAESRFHHGSLNFCEPSRFIEEIDVECIDSPKKASWQGLVKPKNIIPPKPINGPQADHSKLKKINNATLSSGNTGTPGLETNLIEGQSVEHERFGKGKVTLIEGSGANKKATVLFESVGQKQLLLKFAKLRILE
ncbi:MAG: 3'-5' exonuclease [Bacteroidales bacterium]|nr:3'-5' exonuclease [Bacteroidales bacterium]